MQFTTRYVCQGLSRDSFAVVTLRVELADESGVINEANLEKEYLDGFVDGLGDLPETFKIILLDAKVHPIDSSQESFRRVGRLAAMKIHSEWEVKAS